MRVDVWLSVARHSVSQRMNFKKSFKRPLSHASFLETSIIEFWPPLHFLALDHNDGKFFSAMELLIFFQATIDYDGFSMVLTLLDHHH